jgi:hypothetical protein
MLFELVLAAALAAYRLCLLFVREVSPLIVPLSSR